MHLHYIHQMLDKLNQSEYYSLFKYMRDHCLDAALMKKEGWVNKPHGLTENEICELSIFLQTAPWAALEYLTAFDAQAFKTRSLIGFYKYLNEVDKMKFATKVIGDMQNAKSV